jgi:hypothetical protein|tara:strand:+ start:132 stop:356 length:225 start_codon:yes stop_codon:yes gene_type:complete
MVTLDKYKMNLRIHDEFVHGTKIYSYNTHVADIDHREKVIKPNGWYSKTTSQHINYVAQKYGYVIIKNNRRRQI